MNRSIIAMTAAVACLALASCGSEPRSYQYFEAHQNEAKQVNEACKAGTKRGPECHNAWLTAIINYAIQSAALALAFVFVTGTVWSFVGQAHANGAGAVAIYGALLFQLTIVLVGGFLLIQASSIASAIAGGGGASGTPLVSAILPSGRTVRAFTSAARSGGGAAVRGAGRAAVPFAKGVSAGLTRIPGASTRR